MGKGSSSTPRFVHPVMPRPGGELLLLLLDNGLQVVEILVTTAGVDVDVGGPHVEDALPAAPERICGQHGDETEEVEVDLEEVDEVGAAVGGAAVSVRIEPCPDLKDHDDGVEHDPPPAADDSAQGREDQLARVPSPLLQHAPEPDVHETDRQPCENRGETGQGHHPRKNLRLVGRCR